MPKEKSWSKSKPRNMSERRAMPKGCFLLPDKLKFPVCARGSKRVQYDCSGLRAAKIRAAQWGYGKVYNEATELQKMAGCSRKSHH